MKRALICSAVAIVLLPAMIFAGMQNPAKRQEIIHVADKFSSVGTAMLSTMGINLKWQ